MKSIARFYVVLSHRIHYYDYYYFDFDFRLFSAHINFSHACECVCTINSVCKWIFYTSFSVRRCAAYTCVCACTYVCVYVHCYLFIHHYIIARTARESWTQNFVITIQKWAEHQSVCVVLLGSTFFFSSFSFHTQKSNQNFFIKH